MSLHEIFDPSFQDSKVMELQAIWILDREIYNQTGERMSRFAEDDLVSVENGVIASGKPTHKIIWCFGTLGNNHLSFMVKCLKTGEYSTALP